MTEKPGRSQMSAGAPRARFLSPVLHCVAGEHSQLTQGRLGEGNAVVELYFLWQEQGAGRILQNVR